MILHVKDGQKLRCKEVNEWLFGLSCPPSVMDSSHLQFHMPAAVQQQNSLSWQRLGMFPPLPRGEEQPFLHRTQRGFALQHPHLRAVCAHLRSACQHSCVAGHNLIATRFTSYSHRVCSAHTCIYLWISGPDIPRVTGAGSDHTLHTDGIGPIHTCNFGTLPGLLLIVFCFRLMHGTCRRSIGSALSVGTRPGFNLCL